ncbi:phosphoenolpyruvate carboxykinase (ATP) [Sphingomicrobium arenosum]|uniref:hypothetical protein n=1 Tax=Sphingomicrobium arenosum TaxID=2233861 RepID=UPI00224103E9|nr:hypothetical protein [Sphingomicrobium arenosum]
MQGKSGTSGGHHRHGAFGLRFESSMLLPELYADTSGEAPDVHITMRRDAALRIDEETDWRLEPDGTVAFELHGIRYRVRGGREIEVVAPRETPEAMIRVWLLGSVMGALLLKRGMLTVHANAVAFGDGEAAAFLGDSGAGKSTLAASLREAGLRPLCDDLLAVEFDDDGTAWVRPGIPRIKLGPTGAAALGISLEGLPRVAPQIDKYQLPLDRSAPWTERFRLTRLYRIDQGELAIVPIKGREAAMSLLDNLFRPAIGEALADDDRRFLQAMALADGCACFSFSRPFALDEALRHARALQQHLQRPLGA